MGKDLQEAKLHPEVFWSARTLYGRYIRWTGELFPGGQEALERLRDRRIRAHICAPITPHLNKRKVCALGDEHEGAVLATANKQSNSISSTKEIGAGTDREKLLAKARYFERRAGINRLTRQLAIAAERVRAGAAACREALSPEVGSAVDLDQQFRLFDALLLDAESYYSSADRLFRLAGKLLPGELAQRLRETPSVELIHRIRNRFVEHAYEDGDPAQGFGIRDDVGLTLKAASVFEGFGVDPGFEVNAASVDWAIEEFGLNNLPPGDPPPG